MGWYYALPACLTCLAIWSMPAVALPALNKFMNGNCYKRDTECPYIEHFYMRDENLTGSAYVCNGLDALPDLSVKS